MEEQTANLTLGEFCYTIDGDGDPLLLIAGHGAHLTDWNDDLIDLFVQDGFKVIRFDNRDAGRSVHLDQEIAAPSILELWQGVATPPYHLEDMAIDTAELLKHLGIRQVFIVAHSMGAMIAQCLAIHHPNLVKGMVLIAGTTGSQDVGQSSREIQILLADVGKNDGDQDLSAIEKDVRSSMRWASLGMEDENRRRHTARHSRIDDLSLEQLGRSRQMAAIVSAADRTKQLASITAPTALIHGVNDVLIHSSGTKALAKAMPFALVNDGVAIVDEMGHDIPPLIWRDISIAINNIRNLSFSKNQITIT